MTTQRPASLIYLLVGENFWHRTRESPNDFIPLDLTLKRSIRCYRERARLLEKAGMVSRNTEETLVVLSLDEHRLPGPVRDEPQPDGNSDPMIYGKIPKSAIVEITALQRDPETGIMHWPLKRNRERTRTMTRQPTFPDLHGRTPTRGPTGGEEGR